MLIKSDKGKILIISENSSASRTRIFLNENYSTDLSAVIILGDETCAAYYASLSLGCKNVIVFGGYENYQPIPDLSVQYENEFSTGGVSFTFCDGHSLSADCGGIKVGICSDKVGIENCDLLISDRPSDGGADYISAGFSERSILYNAYDFGEMTFNIKDDIVMK